jgi:hypothetical protein
MDQDSSETKEEKKHIFTESERRQLRVFFSVTGAFLIGCIVGEMTAYRRMMRRNTGCC